MESTMQASASNGWGNNTAEVDWNYEPEVPNSWGNNDGPANGWPTDGDADDNAADARDVSLKGGCLIPFVATTMRSERPVACPTAQRSTNDNIQSHVREWPRAS